jgi:lysophospholipase L1-like esterase
MLERLDEVIALRPRELFVEAGINDIAQDIPPGTILANILVLMGRVRLACPGVRIYVTSVLPTNGDARKEYPEVAGKNGVVEDLDRALKEAVEERWGVYIDLKSAVKDVNGELDRRWAAKDGLHLNAAGYGIWIGVIRRVRK